MWFTRQQFALCDQLRHKGLAPRFEPGDLVARGFADLGFEEFQVLPGERLLSLTAGTVSQLPSEHRGHFFWLPSVDEAIELIEARGGSLINLKRVDARSWVGLLSDPNGVESEVSGIALYDIVLNALMLLLQGAVEPRSL
jgi:hypothetical protein